MSTCGNLTELKLNNIFVIAFDESSLNFVSLFLSVRRNHVKTKWGKRGFAPLPQIPDGVKN